MLRFVLVLLAVSLPSVTLAGDAEEQSAWKVAVNRGCQVFLPDDEQYSELGWLNKYVFPGLAAIGTVVLIIGGQGSVFVGGIVLGIPCIWYTGRGCCATCIACNEFLDSSRKRN